MQDFQEKSGTTTRIDPAGKSDVENCEEDRSRNSAQASERGSIYDVRETARRLERRVNLLVMLSAGQSIVLVILLFMSLLPSWTTIVLIMAGVAVFVALCHKRIPGWAGRTTRLIFRKLRSDERGKF